MFKRTFESALKTVKSGSKFSRMNLSRGFSVNLDGLRNILKSEVNHEESNYSPVDQNELKTFFNNTKFQFVDQENTLNMELRKTQGNFEVIVNFQAKPPMPQEEQEGEGQEKSKNIK